MKILMIGLKKKSGLVLIVLTNTHHSQRHRNINSDGHRNISHRLVVKIPTGGDLKDEIRIWYRKDHHFRKDPLSEEGRVLKLDILETWIAEIHEKMPVGEQA